MINKFIIFILLSLLSVQVFSDDLPEDLSEARERTDAYKAYLKEKRSAYQREMGVSKLPDDATLEERREHAKRENDRVWREAREEEGEWRDSFEKKIAEENAKIEAWCDSLEPEKRSKTVSCL